MLDHICICIQITKLCGGIFDDGSAALELFVLLEARARRVSHLEARSLET